MHQTAEVQAPITCPRCGEINPSLARFCQQCGYRLLGPAGAKGAPIPQDGAPTAQPPAGQQPAAPGPTPAPWTQAAMGGLAGFLLGSLFGGGHRGFGGWGGDDWGDGGDWGGGADFGGGDGGGGGGDG